MELGYHVSVLKVDLFLEGLQYSQKLDKGIRRMLACHISPWGIRSLMRYVEDRIQTNQVRASTMHHMQTYFLS